MKDVEKNTAGRPSHEPTEEHYDLVKTMLMDGATRIYMAKSLGLHPETFTKHYGDFIEEVKTSGREQVANKVAELAKAGDAAAAIYLLKEQQKENFAFHEVETDEDPLNFLTKLFMSNDVPTDIRIKAAQAILPYKCAKVAAIGVKESRKGKAADIAKGKGKFGTLSERLANEDNGSDDIKLS